MFFLHPHMYFNYCPSFFPPSPFFFLVVALSSFVRLQSSAVVLLLISFAYIVLLFLLLLFLLLFLSRASSFSALAFRRTLFFQIMASNSYFFKRRLFIFECRSFMPQKRETPRQVVSMPAVASYILDDESVALPNKQLHAYPYEWLHASCANKPNTMVISAVHTGRT